MLKRSAPRTVAPRGVVIRSIRFTLCSWKMPPDLLGPTRYTRPIVNSGSISVRVRPLSGRWRW
jgi:hypothetical protein